MVVIIFIQRVDGTLSQVTNKVVKDFEMDLAFFRKLLQTLKGRFAVAHCSQVEKIVQQLAPVGIS